MILYEKGSTTAEASGTTFTLQDTSNERKLSFKKYYGDTQQSGTPTPSSPQPINVVTGGNTISVVGKNLFSGFTKGLGINSTNGSIISSSTSAISEYIPVDFDTYSSYYVNGLTDTISSFIAGYNERGQFIGRTGGTPRTSTEITPSNLTGGTPQGTGSIKYIIITQYKISGQTGNIDDLDNLQVMLNAGSTPIPYEAYIGRKYEIDLGKNLFDESVLNSYKVGEDDDCYIFNNNSLYNKDITPNVKFEENTAYTFQYIAKQVSGNPRLRIIYTDNTYDDVQTTTIATTLTKYWKTSNPSKTVAKITGSYGVNTANAFYIKKNSCQLEKGFVATDYAEKKTPIELNKINTYQDTIFKSSGKNLFDGNLSAGYFITSTKALTNTTSTIFKSFTIDLKAGTYTLSCNTKINIVRAFTDYDTSNDIIFSGTYININSYTMTLTQDTKLYISVRRNDNTNWLDTDLLMLELGETATTYEPYGKDWYIKKEIGKVVLDGSEDENWNYLGSSYNWFYITIPTMDYTNYQTTLKIMCDYYKARFYSNNMNNGECSFYKSGSNPMFNLKNTDLADVSALRTWLSTHNTIVYYVLNTPTYTIITDTELVEQLDTLYNDAVTYDNVTNIMQSNTGLPVTFDIEYLQPLDFSRNGLGYLPNVLNATVVDEINGEYSLTFEYPINDDMANEIVEDRIVKCKVADGSNQCFVIKKIQKNFDKMTVYCTHLFYMLYDDFLEDTYPQNLSPKPFLDHILSRANYQLPFVANSDIATSKTARYVRKNVVETILGNINNSMYNLWGLELKRDNWNIGLKARLGADKGEKLIFGKNITGVDVSVDTTGIYTRIMPIGFDGLLLPEKYIDAPNINEYPYPRICLYEFPNIRYDANEEDTEAYHTLDEAYQALRDAVQELFDKGINKPLINIKVDWLELSKTEEFKQYSALERVDLGDTLTSNLFGMDYETRVIKTIYNPLNDRIEQFEIGTFKPSITTEMNQLNFDVINLPSSMLDEAQANATQLITQAMGGYVYKTNSELYIMDNPDPAQAVKVWRWNINGLGYSSTGINGTYGIAMTMDGSIVADFITTGQLSANVISASTIIGVINGNTSQLKLDADQIDLTATDVLNILAGNSLNLTSKNITIDSTNFSVDSGGNMTCSNADITGGYVTLIDNPSDPEDRFIIWASDRTRLTTATSQYVITRAWDDNNPGATDYDYTQIMMDGGVTWENYIDSNTKRWGSCRGDILTLNEKVNGSTNTTQITTDGSVISGDVKLTNGTINGGIKVTTSNGDSGSTEYNKWHHIGHISLNSHIQGEFDYLKIYLGDGNNGGSNQQAYIELYMQLGWTGSDNGRYGCNAVLHPLLTGFSSNNTYVKVIAESGSNIQYDIYILTTKTFVVPNVSVDLTSNASFTLYDEYINGAPSGDECNLNLSVAYDDTYSSGTFTATKNSGNANITDAEYRYSGNGIQLLLKFNTSGGSTSVGSNVWEGTISGVPFPFVMATGCSYFGSTCYVGAIQSDSSLTIRVIGSTSAQNNSEHAISFVYFR